MADVEIYLKQFSRFNRHPTFGNTPHKPCLLLAVLDLVESGAITDGRIEYSQIAATEFYSSYYRIVAGKKRSSNSYYPFFHLSKEKGEYWLLESHPNRETPMAQMKAHIQFATFMENIKCAHLAPELFKCMKDSESRYRLREEIINSHFSNFSFSLWKLIEQFRSSLQYERSLRELAFNGKIIPEHVIPDSKFARDSAFKRVVLHSFDYRCAATNLRIIIPEYCAFLKVAHLKPDPIIAINHNPRNGIPLLPTYKSAMDAGLISPGPDNKWYVSSLLSKYPSVNPFENIEGADVFFPKNWEPLENALKWRIENCLAKTNSP